MLSSVFCLNVLDFLKETKSEEYFYTGHFFIGTAKYWILCLLLIDQEGCLLDTIIV